jgi:sentrin-specific protease 8
MGYRYLEHEQLAKHTGSAVVLLRPSMVHLLKSHPSALDFMLGHDRSLLIIRGCLGPRELLPVLPDLKKASHIFLPINDCRDLQIAEGGSHWSLLVVGITDRIAFHYDSLSPSNYIEAQLVHAKLQHLLGFGLTLANLDDTPQQDNGSDCGVHVCWAMQHLLVRRLLAVGQQKEVDMSLGGKRLDASRMRREMYRICEGLRKKASRRLNNNFPRPSSSTPQSSGSSSTQPTPPFHPPSAADGEQYISPSPLPPHASPCAVASEDNTSAVAPTSSLFHVPSWLRIFG